MIPPGSALPEPPVRPGGRLPLNVMHFIRLLRRAGLPVGAADSVTASRALTLIDIGDRRQVEAALRALLTNRREQGEVFDQAFALFWRDPAVALQQAALALLGEKVDAPPAAPSPGQRRVAEAMAPPRETPKTQEETPELDAVMTVSDRELLQRMDFEQMSAAEIGRAKSEIRRLRLPLDLRQTRRWRPDPHGPRIDMAATLRRSLRRGGELSDLSRARRVVRPPPLVVLCDISGSMARYAQILLHFLHAVTNDRDRVHVFLFGTRLSNITRQLKSRDPEVAFQMVAHAVPDWSGGTRIGEALAEFNGRWAKRVLGQGAVVLLVTDGLDRDGAAGLSENMDRLHRSCRRLIWLNPLLRWDGFQPKSQGIRAMLPHVDEFRTVHSLDSIRALIDLLSRPVSSRSGPTKEWRLS